MSSYLRRYSFIWTFQGKKEKDYEQYVLPGNLISLRLLCTIGILGMSIFLTFDLLRKVNSMPIVVSRGSIILTSIVIFVLSFRKRANTFFFVVCAQLLAFIVFVNSFVSVLLAGLPPYYLTNVIFLLIVLVSIISGLCFRHGLIFNSGMMLLFVVYSIGIEPDPYYMSQYPHLFSTYIYINIAAAILERRRRMSFLNFVELKENQKLVVRQNDHLTEEKEKLNVANNRLNDLISLRDRLLSVMAHDIKGPLYNILSLSYLKRHTTHAEAQLMEEKISSAVESTIKLLENILTWSSAQLSQDKNPVYEMVEVFGIANDIIETYRYSAEAKGIQLKLHPQVDVRLVYSLDSAIVHLVLRNLVNNAIKFTDGGSVTVNYFEKNGRLTIEVTDTGVGLEEWKVSEVMGGMVAGKKSVGTRNETGTGLGLMLCQSYLAKLGSLLQYRPNANSNGSVFFFDICRVQANR